MRIDPNEEAVGGIVPFPKPPREERSISRQRRAEVTAERRTREYREFINGDEWRRQKRRVHERDEWRCTEVEHGLRCPYTKSSGALHAHHERYHPRGIRYTPDKDIRTVCPPHHGQCEARKHRPRKVS